MLSGDREYSFQHESNHRSSGHGAPVIPQPGACRRLSWARAQLLLIYVDNVGYGDLGCYGNASVKTPHIDRLSREGVLCTDFYVVTSSCTPYRGALLTGRHPLRNGHVTRHRMHDMVPIMSLNTLRSTYEANAENVCVSEQATSTHLKL